MTNHCVRPILQTDSSTAFLSIYSRELILLNAYPLLLLGFPRLRPQSQPLPSPPQQTPLLSLTLPLTLVSSKFAEDG